MLRKCRLAISVTASVVPSAFLEFCGIGLPHPRASHHLVAQVKTRHARCHEHEPGPHTPYPTDPLRKPNSGPVPISPFPSSTPVPAPAPRSFKPFHSLRPSAHSASLRYRCSCAGAPSSFFEGGSWVFLSPRVSPHGPARPERPCEGCRTWALWVFLLLNSSLRPSAHSASLRYLCSGSPVADRWSPSSLPDI